MYRKYQSSAKSSRNERLAQLSEQESVIEKKKKEILAKLEAQKKKETEEALRKLEPSLMPPSTDKKERSQPFPEYSFTRENGAEDEVRKVTCPRNAFSNDGSFLDQFKKLSSELGEKKLDLSVSASLSRRDEDFDGWQNLRREYNLEENKESSKRNSQSSNVEHQLSPPGLAQLVPDYQIPGAQTIKSNNQALYFTATEGKSKVIPSQNIVDAPTGATEQNTENVTSFGPSHTRSSPIEPPIPIKPQCVSTTVSLQVQALPNSKLNETRGEEYSVGQRERRYSILNVTENTLGYSDLRRNESRSCPKNECSRVSPALTVYDPENKGEGQSRNGGGEESEGPDSCATIPDNKTSPVRMNVPQDFLNSKRSLHDMEEERRIEEWAVEGKMKDKNSCYDSIDSDNNSKDSYHSKINVSFDDQLGKDENFVTKEGRLVDCEDKIGCSDVCGETQKKTSSHKSSEQEFSMWRENWENKDDNERLEGEDPLSRGRRKRKRKSRWGDEVVECNSTSTGMNSNVQLPSNFLPVSSGPGGKIPLLSKLTRSDPGLVQYARQTFGSTNLSEEDWKKAEDHYKINLLYQDMVKKRAEIDRLEKAGKFKYEYDSDEDVEGGTWEHKLRQQEMMATQLWAEELTRQAAGKHHIGDFLPPEELERFMEKYNAVKQGRNPDLSDYKEFKLKEDNVGYRLLQKMGWNEGQGLGQDGTGITNPVNKASTRHENQGLGVDRPDGLQAGDDEYDAYRKRMMLAYRFRPNPLNNPRRPYY